VSRAAARRITVCRRAPVWPFHFHVHFPPHWNTQEGVWRSVFALGAPGRQTGITFGIGASACRRAYHCRRLAARLGPRLQISANCNGPECPKEECPKEECPKEECPASWARVSLNPIQDSTPIRRRASSLTASHCEWRRNGEPRESGVHATSEQGHS